MAEETMVTEPVVKKLVKTRRTRKIVKKVAPKRQAVDAPEAEEAKPKHDVTSPWQRAKILDAPKRAGHVRRWCNKSKEGNIEKKKLEGWVVVKDGSGKEIPKTINDGKNVDGSIHRRELVLMELPMDRKEARDKWIEGRTMTPEKMKARLEADMQSVTGRKGKAIFTVSDDGG